MIRRLFSLVWAVAGRSKTIQDLVAIVWPRSSAPVAVTTAGAAAPVVADAFAPVPRAPMPPEPVAAAPVLDDAPVADEAPVDEAPLVASAAAAVSAADAPASAPADDEAPAAAGAGGPTLRPLGQKEAMDGSVWVPRILWALEFAKLRDLGPQSASDISRVLGEHSGLTVPSPNVARAFRDRKQQGASYWKEVDSQRYEISRAGSAALRKQLRSGES
jgi:hypothetical protein